MAVSNSVFSPNSGNPHEFSIRFLFAKLGASKTQQNINTWATF
jgi:hypothetical protein